MRACCQWSGGESRDRLFTTAQCNLVPAIGNDKHSPGQTQAVVRAPKKLSVCQDLVIDLSGSYGTSGRSLNYTYGIFPNAPNDVAISTMLFGWSLQQKIDKITIPYELIEPGIEYRIAIYVTNFLRVFQRNEHAFMRMDYAVPSIEVHPQTPADVSGAAAADLRPPPPGIL